MKGYRRGETHHQARLSEVEAREIVAKYEAGDVSVRQLGAWYGISHAAVYKIVTGKTWRETLASPGVVVVTSQPVAVLPRVAASLVPQDKASRLAIAQASVDAALKGERPAVAVQVAPLPASKPATTRKVIGGYDPDEVERE